MDARIDAPERPSLDPVPRLLLKMDETATAINCSRAKVYQLVMAGEIPSVLIGRSRRVPLDGLRQWIVDNQSRSA